jgi:pimeloyl-ACP methyl ester carboxylesterase
MELNYKKFGEGDSTILILHGFLGSLDNWQTVAKHLSDHYTVFTIDQRNHGRSPHSEEMDYHLLANDIVWFCTQHALQTVSIIGHSMGGKVAMLVALVHPGLIDKLVVVDIAPVPYEGGHESLLFAMAEAPIKTMVKRDEVDTFLQPRIPNFGVRQFVMKNLSRDDEGKFVWKCNLESLIMNYRNLMDFPRTAHTFTGNVYFIKGEQSGYITKENWPACKEYFPSAELQSVNYAGHWVHADNPEGFLETLVSALK